MIFFETTKADDWVVKNNCTNFEVYSAFNKKIFLIEKELIFDRNQIDKGIKEDQKNMGVIAAFL